MPAKRGKSVRKGKTPKAKDVPKKEPEVVTLKFLGGHQYTGIVSTSGTGKRSLDAPQATYTWKDGPTYEGPFLDSQLEGFGKYTWPDGSCYEGTVVNGKRHGHGVYKAADGITKYEGQWFEGKRHGTGQLTYDSAGEAFYSGQWEDGCKHGEGRQVWASKNVYEGQWRQGAMSGYGTMLWQDGGATETYSGHWENGLPQGTGKHVWQTPDSTRPELGSKEMPSQQTNNSYQGQWLLGVRQGVGIFQYASGASYHGDWLEGIKQGEGRYTYEDGNVYSGQFVADNMATPGASRYSDRGNAALNIGGTDNPVRRCMDVSDLEAFCVPNDRGERDPKAEGTSAYDEPDEVLREVFNTLLRNMAELKTVYGKLRKSLQTDDNDPWVVCLHQFWILARDAGLVLPDCPLSRLNRHLRSGPRHHMEACNIDAAEVRPLTPRQHHPEANSRLGMAKAGSRSGSKSPPGEVADPSGEAKEGAVQQEEEEEEDEEDGDELESAAGSREGDTSRRESRSRLSDAASVASHGAEEEASHGVTPVNSSSIQRASISIKPEPLYEPMYSKFWRTEGALEHEPDETLGGVYDVHSPEDKFMFRHFLESIVRLSPARFPDFKGLERMVKTLLRDHLLPLAGPPSWTPDAQNFHFLAEKQVQQVFASFRPKIWQVFVENASGDGAYQRPLWAKPSEDAASERLPLGRLLRRQFGGVQRRVHVRARLDVTIRVKDVLQVLDKAGLLQCNMRRSDVVDWTGTIFLEQQRPGSSNTENTEPIADLGNLGDLLALGSSSPSPVVPSRPSTGLDQAGVERQETRPLEEVGDDDGNHTPDASTIADFLKSDFRATFRRVLSTLTEVMLPEHANRITWTLDREASPELVSLLDFLETELTFAEFQRLLLYMAQHPRLEASEDRKIPRHICLENFLEKIFVPALAEPFSYVAEGRGEEGHHEEGYGEKGHGDQPDAAEQQEEGEAVEAGQAAVEESGEPGGDEADEALLPEPELNFWRGFCEPYDLEVCVPGAPRIWPEGWAEEVSSY